MHLLGAQQQARQLQRRRGAARRILHLCHVLLAFVMSCLVIHSQGPLGSKPGSCQADPARRAMVVMVTDSCPECASNQLDLQALTWEKVWRLSLPVTSCHFRSSGFSCLLLKLR